MSLVIINKAFDSDVHIHAKINRFGDCRPLAIKVLWLWVVQWQLSPRHVPIVVKCFVPILYHGSLFFHAEKGSFWVCQVYLCQVIPPLCTCVDRRPGLLHLESTLKGLVNHFKERKLFGWSRVYRYLKMLWKMEKRHLSNINIIILTSVQCTVFRKWFYISWLFKLCDFLCLLVGFWGVFFFFLLYFYVYFVHFFMCFFL